MVWKISAMRMYLQAPSAIPDLCVYVCVYVCVCGFVFFFFPCSLDAFCYKQHWSFAPSQEKTSVQSEA